VALTSPSKYYIISTDLKPASNHHFLSKHYDHVHTPWVWRPRDLDEDDQESTSQDQTSPTHNHTRKSSENINTENPENFTAKRELQPTFSVNIVRTPEHYRRQSSGSNPSTPSRNSSRESRQFLRCHSPWNSLMSPGNNGVNGGSRDSGGGSPDSSGLSASGPILGDQLSDEPASMLSPLIMSHTPKPGASPLRSLRGHVTHPLIGSSLEPIPEASNIQNDSKLKPKDRRPAPVTHSSSLPTMTSSQSYGGPHPSPHRDGYEKERDRRDKERAPWDWFEVYHCRLYRTPFHCVKCVQQVILPRRRAHRPIALHPLDTLRRLFLHRLIPQVMQHLLRATPLVRLLHSVNQKVARLKVNTNLNFKPNHLLPHLRNLLNPPIQATSFSLKSLSLHLPRFRAIMFPSALPLSNL
jgi:hypothetical protein